MKNKQRFQIRSVPRWHKSEADRENCSLLKPHARGWPHLRQLRESLFRRIACSRIFRLLFCLLVTFACLQTEAATPTISSISPNSGPTAGGNIVTIDGTYLQFATSVTFGGTAATIAYNPTTGKLQATTPAHAAGAVNVTVTTPGGSVTSINGYTYVAPPTISSISPNSGSTAGGNTVTIDGTYLQFATSVTFGGTAATIAYNPTTGKLQATTPAHAAGAVNVTVTTPGGSVTSTSGYTYVAPPSTLTVTSPNGGENWPAGTTHSITWSVSGSTANVWYYKVALSTDDGVTWPAAGTANDLTPDGIVDPNARSFSWPISSSLNTTQARIRVRAIDFDGFIIGTLSDASDANFTISSSASPDIRIAPTTLEFNSSSANPPIYVEIDWMQDGTHSHRPSQTVIDRVVQTFATEGFAIHIDVNQAIPHQDVLQILNSSSSPASSSPAVQAIRDQYFDHINDSKYYYSIWCHNISGAGIQPDSSGIADLPGRIHLVSLGSLPGQVGTENQQVGTFIHELGHNLGQRHGGVDDGNYKPNYISVMNYLYQMGGVGDTLVDLGLASSSAGINNFGYSHGTLQPLDENNLDETVGVGLARAVDWNCNGVSTDLNVAKDLQAASWCNASGSQSLIADFDNWGGISANIRSGVTPAAKVSVSPVEPCIGFAEYELLRKEIARIQNMSAIQTNGESIRADAGAGDSPNSGTGLGSATTFTIYNDGVADLTINSISLDQSAAWISWWPSAPFTVAPGQSRGVTVYIDYSLTPVGQTTRRLLVYSNDADESPYPGGVNVSVTGLAPTISVTPASQDFGSIPTDTTVDQAFAVQNTGGGTLSGNASVSSPFSVVSGSPYSLTANQSTTVTLRYSPTSAGSDSQNVSFTGGGGATRQVSGSAYLPTVDAPTISPNGGNFAGSVQVTLACSTALATIRYTTDGSDPTGSSTVYSVPFTLTSSAPVKAKAFKSGCNDSAIATASFIVAFSPILVSPRLTGSTFTVSAPTQVGFNYVLEFKNSLSDANWTPVHTNSGNGGQIGLTNTGAVGPIRFYRVRVQ
jgi:hypothetical protein